jgi:WD40 repeat protein
VAFLNDFLVVASNLGVQVWSEQGDNLIFFYPKSSLKKSYDEDAFMRGLASVGNSIAVGTSSGEVLVFSNSSSSSSEAFSLAFNLESEGKPICALSSSRDSLAAGNDIGSLFGYDINQAFDLTFTFPGAGYPCTAMCQKGDVLFAGFSTGHIRIYRTDIHELALEVTAHTRAITGLVMDDRGDTVASCSPDQNIHFWSVPEFHSVATSGVHNLHSVELENKICTGAAFSTNNQLVVASYDDCELLIVKQK